MSEANWEIHPEAVRVGASEHVHTHHLGAHHEQAIMYQHEGGNAAIEEGHDTIVPTLPPQEPYEELEDSSEYPTEQHHDSDERGEGVSTAKEGGEKDSMNTIQEKWAKHIEDLILFKEKYGHVNVSRNEHKELGRFVNNQRQNYRKLLEGKSSSLTVERIQDLERLGFIWTMKPETLTKAIARQAEKVDAGTKKKVLKGTLKSADGIRVLAQTEYDKKGNPKMKDDETWKLRLDQLKRFNAESGHFRVPCSFKRGTKRPRESGKLESAPDPELVKLGKWVKRQRRHYAIDKLPPERLSALKEINFEFKPGNATKEERISVQLGLLDALRKRRELSNAQVADLNFLYDEWKRRAEEGVTVPVHVQNSEEGKNKFDLKWMQKFEELKDFKTQHGHTRVTLLPPKANDSGTANRALAKWVDYQRQSYWKRKQGLNDSLNNERIGLLESIGFEWRIRISLPVQPLLSAKAISVHGAVGDPATNEGAIPCIEDSSVDLSSIFHETKPMEHEGNGHEYKWNLKYDQLKRYNDLLGTTHVPSTVKNKNHAVYSSQLAFLAKWVETQRKLFQKRKKGQKSGLSKSRINMLNKIGFDWNPPPGKPVDFRGWNAKLEKLKEYSRLHGDTRVPTRKKKGENDPNFDPELQRLAKWVEHQRGLYWKRARGEKSSLSDGRIAALEAIGFEWRIIGDSRLSSTADVKKKTNAKGLFSDSPMYDHQKDDEAEGNVDEIGVLEYSGSELKGPDGIITTDSNNDMIEMSAADNIINAIDVPTTEGGVMI